MVDGCEANILELSYIALHQLAHRDVIGAADSGGRLRILHRHRIESIDHAGGAIAGALAIDEDTGAEARIVPH